MKNLIGRTQKLRVLKEALCETQIVYFYGYFASGKTALLHQLQAVWPGETAYLSCKQEAFSARLRNETDGASLILLDDLGSLPQTDEEILRRWLEELPDDVHVVMASRGKPSGILSTHFISGRMHVMDARFVYFDREETQQFLLDEGMKIDSGLLDWLMENTKGWILVITLFVRYGKLNPELLLSELNEQVGMTVRESWEREVFSGLDMTDKRLLRDISLFDRITPELAYAVTGILDAQQRLTQMEHSGGYLIPVSKNVYTWGKPVRRFLQEKLQNEADEDYLNRLYCAAAEFYEHQGMLPEAMECYRKTGKMDEIARKLEEHSRLRPGNGFYTELEAYYFMLDDSIVMNSPAIMEGISVLFSLLRQVEESERYYRAIQDYQKRFPKGSREYQIAQQSLLYLDIALPHRGSDGMIDTLKLAAKIVLTPGFKMHEINVAGNGPSLVNGGKDFCKWLPQCRLLYTVLRKPAELALGKSGAGLGNIALAEGLFEIGLTGDYSESIALLSRGLAEAEEKREFEMQFAAQGIFSRLFTAEGQAGEALRRLEAFEKSLPENAAHQMRLNLEAEKVYLSMLDGSKLIANQWLKTSAPDENQRFVTLDRYRLMLKARIYIINNQWIQARSLLIRLARYFELYGRPYGGVKVALLMAVVCYRSGTGDWQSYMREAFRIAGPYGLVRVFADEGMLILEMMSKMELENAPYEQAVLSLTRRHAALYPKFMRQTVEQQALLTDTEEAIYRLILSGMSNDQIGLVMDITLRTVKFHTSNIYKKLGVKNRTEAILRAAQNDDL